MRDSLLITTRNRGGGSVANKMPPNTVAVMALVLSILAAIGLIVSLPILGVRMAALSGTGTTNGQKRITGVCAPGTQAISVTAEGGLICDGSVPANEIDSDQLRVQSVREEHLGNCSVRGGIGGIVCDGTLVAGDVNSGQIQLRVTGRCESGFVVDVSAAGGVTCSSILPPNTVGYVQVLDRSLTGRKLRNHTVTENQLSFAYARGQPNGVATLDTFGHVPYAQLPPVPAVSVCPDGACCPGVEQGHGNICILPNQTLIWYNESAGYVPITSSPGAVISVNGQVGAVVLSSDAIPQGSINRYLLPGSVQDQNIALPGLSGTSLRNGTLGALQLASSYQRAAAGGLATLDSSGRVPPDQLPPLLTFSSVIVCGNLSCCPGSSAGSGNICILPSATYIWQSNQTGYVSFAMTPESVQSVNGQTGVVLLTSDSVSQGSVNHYLLANSVNDGHVQLASLSGSRIQNATLTAVQLEASYQRGAPAGIPTLDAQGRVPRQQLPETLTVVTVCSMPQTCCPGAAAGVGNICVLPNATIIWQSNQTGYVILTSTPNSVLSVNGYTGHVLLDSDDIPAGSTNRYLTVGSVGDPQVIVGSLSGSRLQNGTVDALQLSPPYQRAVPNGVATLDGSGKVPPSQLPVLVAMSTVNVCQNASCCPGSEGGVGNVCVLPNVTYIWQSNATGYVTLAFNPDRVVSVNTKTGVVVLNTDDIPQGSVNRYLAANSVGDLEVLRESLSESRLQNGTLGATQMSPPYQRAVSGGLATLDSSGRVPSTQLPPAITVTVCSVAACCPGASAGIGNLCIMPTSTVVWQSDQTGYIQVSSPVFSVNGRTGIVLLDSDAVPQGSTNRYLTPASVGETQVITGSLSGSRFQNGTITSYQMSAPYQRALPNGLPTLDSSGKVPLSQLPLQAFGITVTVCGALSCCPGAAGGEGNLCILPNGTIAWLPDQTGYALLTSTPDFVFSVNGLTGHVVLTSDQVSEGSTNRYLTVGSVGDPQVIVGSLSGSRLQNGTVDALQLSPHYQRAVANGVATLDGSGKVPPSQLPVLVAMSTVTVCQNASCCPGSEGGVGNVCVLPNVTYIWQSNATGYVTIAYNPDRVVSVNTKTGVVVLNTDDIPQGSLNRYLTVSSVSDTQVVFGGLSGSRLQNGTLGATQMSPPYQRAVPGGLATLDTSTGLVPYSQLPTPVPVIICGSLLCCQSTSVASGTSPLCVTPNATYAWNSNQTGYVQLSAPANLVQSVNGRTGVVVLDSDAITQGTTNRYLLPASVSDIHVDVGSLSGSRLQNGTITESKMSIEYRRGLANGVPTLDGSGKVPLSQLPPLASNTVVTWCSGSNSTACCPGAPAGAGNVCILSNITLIWQSSSASYLPLSDAVSLVNGRSGVVALTTDDVPATTNNLYLTLNSVGSAQLRTSSVTGIHLQNATIQTIHLAGSIITAAKMALSSVSGGVGGTITDGTIVAADVNSAQVQLRVTGVCSGAGVTMTGITVAGGVTCDATAASHVGITSGNPHGTSLSSLTDVEIVAPIEGQTLVYTEGRWRAKTVTCDNRCNGNGNGGCKRSMAREEFASGGGGGGGCWWRARCTGKSSCVAKEVGHYQVLLPVAQLDSEYTVLLSVEDGIPALTAIVKASRTISSFEFMVFGLDGNPMESDIQVSVSLA